MTDPLLEVRDLVTAFHFLEGAYVAVNRVSFSLKPGEVLGLVGESGSGKSVTGLSLIGLIDAPGEVVGGEILFKGRDLTGLGDTALREVRGKEIAMIFQDSLAALNPVLTIGEQMTEAITEHGGASAAEARERAIAALRQVGITSPEERFEQYPHEFSGGMRQRVAIATALLNHPDLIIADEPTTALDVTIQGQILAEMQTLQRETGTAIIWITHDLGVISELADRVAVMYAGQIVEIGEIDDVLDRPRHPYTRGLLDSIPAENAPGTRLHQIDGAAPRLSAFPVGCPFRPRCERAQAVCAETMPDVTAGAAGHEWRCHNPVPEETTR